MIGYSPKFPLQIDDLVGAYTLNTTIKEVVRQNFINLVLTSPGERIMDINFGVGARRYLFEQNTSGLQTQIARDVHTQVKRYLPFISLNSIKFNTSELLDGFVDQILDISISYSIPSTGEEDTILISNLGGA